MNEMLEPLHDLAAVDRDVAQVRARLKHARDSLAKGGTPSGPFEARRYVSQQKTYLALRELKVSAVDTPLRDALAVAVASLLFARTGWSLEEEASKREHAVPQEEGDSALSYADAHRLFQTTAEPRRLEAALETWARRAHPVAAVNDERRSRAGEVARVLGFDHPLTPFLPVPPASLADASVALLARTSDLARALRKRTPAADGLPLPVDTVIRAHAVEGADGWPKHVSGRFMQEAFPAFSSDLNRVPIVTTNAVSPLSFARAAELSGVFLRQSLAPASLQFSLRFPPCPVDAWRWGAALSSCLANEVFHERVLGVPKGRAVDQARRMAEGIFWSLRIRAAATICDLSPRVHASEFEELTSLAFGSSLPGSLCGAWPSPSEERATRFLGALLAPHFAHELTERFERDWFRNPRCGTFLRAEASRVGLGDVALDLPEAVRSLVNLFEQVLA